MRLGDTHYEVGCALIIDTVAGKIKPNLVLLGIWG